MIYLLLQTNIVVLRLLAGRLSTKPPKKQRLCSCWTAAAVDAANSPETQRRKENIKTGCPQIN